VHKKPEPSYHHGDLKNALLRSAMQEIERSGVESLSVRALARELGVTHRAAYVHFKTKNMLISAVIAAAYDDLAGTLEQVDSLSLAPEECLMRVAIVYSKLAFSRPNMFMAMTGPRMNTHDQYPELEAALARAWSFIQAPIRSGCEAGVFSCDLDGGAVYFWGGLQGILSQCILGRIKLSKKRRDEFVHTSVHMLIRGMHS
jgi:AcrR family transcriptional regulator